MQTNHKFTQFQLEENQIIEHIVFDNFYPRFKHKTINFMNLEFFITSTCNKKCTYCYLHKNEDKLYPVEIRKPELILNNLRILLDHLSEYNNGQYNRLDLFSGEIWGTKFGNDFFDILLEYMKNKKVTFNSIIVPSNCSFITNDEQYQAVESYIRRFHRVDCRLIFSCSSDGLIIEEQTRPYNVTNHMALEDFYNKLWEFCDHHHFCFHPMVDAHTIDLWQENLNWWIQQMEKYDEDFFNKIMMLEVRNPNSWNDHTITSYLKFLKQLTEYVYHHPEYYHKDNEFFIKDTLGLINQKESLVHKASYFPWSLHFSKRASCSVTQTFSVRLGDLAICPCHRLAYPKLLYGKYIVEDGKITGIEANNIAGMLNHYITGYNGYLKCDTCAFANYCVKGCHGAQFEDSKEYLYPIESVCELEQVKTLYIVINTLKLMESLDCQESHYLEIKSELDNFMSTIKNKYAEVYEKWYPVIQTLLLET